MVFAVISNRDFKHCTNAPGRHTGIVDRIGITVADAWDMFEQFLTLPNPEISAVERPVSSSPCLPFGRRTTCTIATES